MWVFGYGSLIWKVDFPYEKQVPGYIKGYVRRFWQGSNDHRGTPESPGRVLTILPLEEWQLLNDEHPVDHEGRVYGIAFKIPDDKAEAVKAHLDHREKNGYSLYKEDVYQDGIDEPVIRGADVYIGTTENEAYLGPAPVDELAKHIYTSAGPSGPNTEYLFNLTIALKSIFPKVQLDHHLSDLDQAVRRLLTQSELRPTPDVV